jgi:hypothetical protein
MSKRMVVPVLLLFASFAVADAAQQRGRYKKQGTNCEWDANDTGPNQCTPATRGRFKRDGDTCRWDANDNGPDQCRPASGRWKKDGDACTWSSSDSGPDQCNPRTPR